MNQSIFIKIILLSLVIVPFINAKADYYTYVPSQSTKLLYIYNTTLENIVDVVSLFGTARNVLVNHTGTKVYVSTVVEDRSRSKSYINILNTVSNQIESRSVVGISGEFGGRDDIKGLVLNKDDNILYVSHQDGITKIERPGITNVLTHLDLIYGGLNLIMTDDDKYLFVLGYDDNKVEGISIVETATFTEIYSFSFDSAVDANEILFNNNLDDPQLYIVQRSLDKVISLKIENYNSSANFNLAFFAERDFVAKSNPIDIALSDDKTEIFVVLSFLEAGNDGVATGNGNVVVLDASDISTTNVISGISEIFLGFEESSFLGDEVIHPLAINIDDKGFIYILKQIWSDKAGLYINKLKDSTSSRTGKRTIEVIQTYNLGERVSTLANGQFLGPDCEFCPTGEDEGLEIVERPAAINVYILLLLGVSIIIYRRFKTFGK